MSMRPMLLAISAAAAAMLLAGCSGTGDYRDLHRERQTADELPAVALEAESAILPDTSRLVGEHEGAQLWLARAEEGGVCLVVDPGDDGWGVTCAGAGGGLRTGDPSVEYIVVTDDQPAPEGATAISHNVYVLD